MIKKILFVTLYALICISLVALAVKGQKENPLHFQTVKDTSVGGPFESSNNTSRYALTEAIAEDKTFFFNNPRARFATPDVEEYNGKIFSIFTPGVSFLGLPFYFLGKTVGLPQLLTYSSTVLLALINVLLIIILARKFGGGTYTSILAGFLFLFGTNALTYALTFTQHHASISLILLALLNVMGERTLIKNIYLGVLYSAALLVDLPNGILMLPIIIYALHKHLKTKSHYENIKFTLKLNIIGLLIGAAPFLTLFGWYNYQTTGSYIKVAQMLGRRVDVLPSGEFVSRRQLTINEDEPVRLPFNPRNQLSGLYILLLSDERSWIWYSPVVLLGIVGLILTSKRSIKRSFLIIASSGVLTTTIAYSMFGDPWGGWAFGPRYLIPAAAVLCSGIGIALERYKRKVWFIIPFMMLAMYSIGVNVLGAMTTTQIPPKVEAVNLPSPIPYTYEYNWELMTEKNLNSSLFYNLYLSDKLSSRDFALLYASAAFGLVMILYLASIFENHASLKNTEGKGK